MTDPAEPGADAAAALGHLARKARAPSPAATCSPPPTRSTSARTAAPARMSWSTSCQDGPAAYPHAHLGGSRRQTAARSAGARFGHGRRCRRRRSGRRQRQRLRRAAVDLQDRRHARPRRASSTRSASPAAATPAQKLDLEGITLDGEGGFWLASEGRTDRLIPHALYHVDADGEIEQEIALPAELLRGRDPLRLRGHHPGRRHALDRDPARMGRRSGEPRQARRLQHRDRGMGRRPLPARPSPRPAGSACPRSPPTATRSTSSSATTRSSATRR